VWQPTLEYFLPIQMCHMRINDRYRVWHGSCHLDDARMAPVDFTLFDGYRQGPSTLCRFHPGEPVPGLNVGGWHDAGDDDLRIESQTGTMYGLALAYEAFGVTYDNTTIDQEHRVVEIQRPDGKPDVLQQIEHGALSVVGGYKAMGRFYRGIIVPTKRQYTHLGEFSMQTDNAIFDPKTAAANPPPIGAGVTGLATARELIARGATDILVLEKESEPGRHASGRNSGVLHAGVYYAPGSERARTCAAGARLIMAAAAREMVQAVAPAAVVQATAVPVVEVNLAEVAPVAAVPVAEVNLAEAALVAAVLVAEVNLAAAAPAAENLPAVKVQNNA
jgi:hypothetical protein